VSLICPESEFMPFLEADLRATLKRRMKRSHILFVHEPISNISLEEDCVRVSLQPRVFPVTGTGNDTSPPVQRILPQRKLRVDRVLYSGGRNANSESLNCEALGIRTGKYGRIEVDRDCRTTSPCSIFAVGDVTGAGLASTAQQQARKLCETLFLEGGDAQEERDEDIANDEWSDLDVQVDDDFLSPTDTVVVPESNSLFGGERSSDIPLTL
jgi:pyruvate/2-oxoglutarate dehydrogenase complex dihydrolipoamide dehydrogenase (E3) component